MGLRPAHPFLRRVPHSRGLRRLRRLTRRDPVQLLKQLPEQEQRARLLELLRADLQSNEEIADETWQMPSLTADGRTADLPGFNFQTRVCDLQILQGVSGEAMENLTKTCRLLFPLDGSSWMPCTADPRCLAERLAQEVFEFHAKGFAFDPKRSGAEWWVQIRVAVERHGVNVHPHLSTVTYLTECGAPTLILQCRNSLRPSETAQVYGSLAGGTLSWPKLWKHLAFDGQLLHGTVPKALAKRLGDLPHRFTFSAFQAMPRWSPVSCHAGRFRTRFGRRRLLHEISCRLPHRSGDTTAGTLQLHWASKDAMLGPVEKGRKREMVSAGGGEKKGCLKGEIH
ncbi:unnamed protein product [Cladocopium goreaui]|uniref:Uncharacterized protein n=1 Tax=Cladocopium goreaui TaxID=2562237 RepID=A0A9P1CZL1_9DINO|nr:unnamed protein product [Cladocopium goreaui]